jgi:SAM-dependent methyltransferase
VEIVDFRCNVCGAMSSARRDEIDREIPGCPCGSTLRWRSVIHVLSLGLFGKSLAIDDFPTDHARRGIGMSDWDGYALRLPAKLDYVNTFLERDPRLDITEFNPKLESQLDFIISSDVFEHVPPPVERAFENSRRMLRPGGVLVLTVPYSLEPHTREHFPELFEYRVEVRDGGRVLLNTTRDGRQQEFDDLVFHGDTACAGGSLEMRVFSRADLLAQLERAGFRDITTHDEPELAFGIEWHVDWSLPISARAP